VLCTRACVTTTGHPALTASPSSGLTSRKAARGDGWNSYRRIADKELTAAGGATVVHPEGEWQAESSWDSCDQGRGGANGRTVNSGTDFRVGFSGLFVWFPNGEECAPAPEEIRGHLQAGRQAVYAADLIRYDFAREATGVSATPGDRP